MVAYAREVLRAFGVAPVGPTLITTDNLANQKVAAGVGCPTRSRHFLRRYFALKQRISSGEVMLKFTPDAQQPADFLTKWIPQRKFIDSLRYATNNFVPRTAAKVPDAATEPCASFASYLCAPHE